MNEYKPVPRMDCGCEVQFGHDDECNDKRYRVSKEVADIARLERIMIERIIKEKEAEVQYYLEVNNHASTNHASTKENP